VRPEFFVKTLKPTPQLRHMVQWVSTKRRKASMLFAHMTACPPTSRQSIDGCPLANCRNDSRKWNAYGGITALPRWRPPQAALSPLSTAGFPVEATTFANAIRAADGVIIVSPEYNWSIPGALKKRDRLGVAHPGPAVQGQAGGGTVGGGRPCSAACAP
jgi:hypothetical protein